MMDEEKIETTKEYSFNWVSLGIKVIIFAILLVLFIWVLSLVMGKKCQTLTNDYYVVSSFTDKQYNTKGDNEYYEYRYTLKLLDITTNDSENVSIKAYNYFHDKDEYNTYLTEENKKIEIISQSSGNLNVDSADSLKSSSLTANEFSYDVSDIYTFENDYYIDVTLKIKDHYSINDYYNNYFVPIHLTVEYTQTNNCRPTKDKNKDKK